MSLLKKCRGLARRSPDCDEKRNVFDWDLYAGSFWKFIVEAASLEECEDSVDSLLDNLLKYDCEDLVLSRKLINFIAMYRNSRCYASRRVAAQICLSELDRCTKLSSTLLFGRQSFAPRSALNFMYALKRSDCKLLTLLMKYGITLFAADEDFEKIEILSMLQLFYLYLIRVEQVSGDLMMDREDRFGVSEFMAKSYYREVSRLLDIVGHKRLMQLLLGVKAILKKRRGEATYQEYAECVRIYFRAINSPFLSTTEIRSLLQKFGIPKPVFIESLCQVFNEVFPECLGTPHAPRRLKELCRAEVREILMFVNEQRATTLPVAVSALCIPHKLKGYLLGEE